MDDIVDKFLKRKGILPSSKPEPPDDDDDSVPRVLDDEFAKLGYSPTQRLSILGDVGRENAWKRNVIFKGHSDPKNKVSNRGIISWQGSRRKKLDEYLQKEGVLGRGDDDELRGMARFMDREMKEDFPDVYEKLRSAPSTYDASEALRKYIKYVPDAPYNSPDPEFRVKNNADWAKKAQKLGLAQDKPAFESFEDIRTAILGKKPRPVHPDQPLQTPEVTAQPAKPPIDLHPSFRKREPAPGQAYYDFEVTGRVSDNLAFTHEIGGDYYAQNRDGDIYQLDHASKAWKPIAPTKRAMDADGEAYDLAQDQSGVGEGHVRRSKDGVNYLFSPDGKIKQEGVDEVLKVLEGKTPPKSAFPKDGRLKGYYDKERRRLGLKDTEEARQQFIQNEDKLKAGADSVFSPAAQSLLEGAAASAQQGNRQPIGRRLLQAEMRVPQADKGDLRQFTVQVDPDAVEPGMDRNEGVFRQGLTQLGQRLYGRPLSQIEIEAATEYQRQVKGGFVFAKGSKKPIEPTKGDYVFEDIGGLKKFLDEHQEDFAEERRERLKTFLAQGGELTDETRKKFESLGFTPDEMESHLRDQGFKEEINRTRQDFEQTLSMYRQAPDEDTRMNALTYARRAMGWLSPREAADELGDFAELRAEKAAELNQVGRYSRSAEFEGMFLPTLPEKGKEVELQTYLNRIIEKYGTATNRKAVQRQEDIAEAARQQRVSLMSWGQYISQSSKDFALGISKAAVSTAIASSLRGIGLGAKAIDDALGMDVDPITGAPRRAVSEYATYQAGESLDRFLEHTLPTHPDLQQEFWQGKLPQGIGSSIGMFLGGASKFPRLAVAVMSSLQMGGDAYKEAKQAGATEEEAQFAGLLQAPLGVTEIFGMGSIISRLNRGTGGGVWKRLWGEVWRAGAREIPEEITQEGFQTVAGNIVKQLVYDPDRRADKDLFDNMMVAGIAAPLASSGVTMLNFARNRQAIKQIINQEQAEGSALKYFGDGELYVLGQPVEVAPELAPLVSKYDFTRNLILSRQGEIAGLEKQARSAKSFGERRDILREVWSKKAEIEGYREVQGQVSRAVVEASGVEIPEGTIGDALIPETDEAIDPKGAFEIQDEYETPAEPLEGPETAVANEYEAEIPESPASMEPKTVLPDAEIPQSSAPITDERTEQAPAGSVTESADDNIKSVAPKLQDTKPAQKRDIGKVKTPAKIADVPQGPITAQGLQVGKPEQNGDAAKVRSPKTVKQQADSAKARSEESVKQKTLSNTQVEFSPEQAKPFDDFRRTVIDKADVADKSVLPEYAKDGIFEIEPHVTVKYGLESNKVEDVAPTLKGEKPIVVELGKTSVFKGSEKKIPGTDEPVPYDVVTVAVKSPDLERLNKKLTEGQENTTTFPYSPHVTLAYIKPGIGEKYANRADFEGQKYTFDGVTFSPADKSGKAVIPLGEEEETSNDDAVKKFEAEGVPSGSSLVRGSLERLRKKKEAEAPKADDGFSDLDDLLGGSLKSVAEPVETEFDEAKYAKFKPALEKAFAAIEGETSETRVDAFIDKLNERYTLEQLETLEPYLVRFVDENVLQSGSNESIEEVDDTGESVTADTGTRDGEQSLADAERPAEDLESGQRSDADNAIVEQPTDSAPEKPDTADRPSSKPSSRPEQLTSGGQRDLADGRIAVADSPTNFTITDELDFVRFSPKQRFRDNIAALSLLKTLDSEERQATHDEQSVLARYVGWGGLKQVFDEKNNDWAKERQALKALVTDEEFERARRSVLDAHYTSKAVVQSIWAAIQRFGFEQGTILEPSMGTGNFIGLMPKGMQNHNVITGVELDPLTSRIAKQLYPHAEIHNKGFQDVFIAGDSVDVAIGNPPFGDQSIFDKNSPERSKFKIHSYFFAKTVDSLRPGGVLAMVVSKGFMDSRDVQAQAARDYIGKKTQLLGAIRLPNTAFGANANTEVTTDIVFLQKVDGSKVSSNYENWNKIGLLKHAKDEIPVNIYFADNPDMMLGRMTLAGSMYRANEPTLEPFEDQDLEADLAQAIEKLPEQIFSRGNAVTERLANMEGKDLDQYDGLRPFNYGINDKGEAFQLLVDFNEKAYEVPVKANERELERMTGMIELRSTVRELLSMEANEHVLDAGLMPIRKRLNDQYDAFVKKNGFISNDANKRVFREDADCPLLMALEMDYDRGISKETAKKEEVDSRQPSAGKADIFTKRTITPTKIVTDASTAEDAMLSSLNERGHIDLKYMFDLYQPESMQAMINELGDLIFRDPDLASTANPWVTKDAYLSGDVKTKLTVAQKAAEESPSEYARNLAALEEVQPPDKAAPDIFVKLGSPWVPIEDYRQFVAETIDGNIRGNFNAILGRYLDLKVSSQNQTLNTKTWGTDAMPASKIVELLLENKQPRVMKPLVRDGKVVVDENNRPKMTVDEDKTAAAFGKSDEIQEKFLDWLWADQERRQRLSALYNERFNRRVQRQYDGSYLTFPGKNTNIRLRPHQANFASRAIQTGVVLADHVVGAGKTFGSIAAAIEMRRLCLAKKPLFAVPNHLVEQWARDFKLLYPGSNVLAASKKDFEGGKRRQFFAKIATGDWDAVIVAHSSFGIISVPPDVEKAFLREQVAELNAAIDELRETLGKKDRSVRDMEKAKERLEEKLKRLNDRRRDDLLNFQEMGIDALFVDEAHKFKNLFFTTQKQGVGSLGDPAGSQRAFDMFMKVRMTLDKNNGRNVFFLTGTPISNSLAEIFHMQRYLQYDTLKRQGIHTFDAWANTFGQDTMDWELDASGKFRQKLRFVKFANLRELRQIWREVTDSITNDDIRAAAEAEGRPFPIPKIERIRVIAPRSESQAEYIGVPMEMTDAEGNVVHDEEIGVPMTEYEPGTIIYRMENWKAISTDENRSDYDPKENVLRITGDARKAGLDMRTVSPHYAHEPEGKIQQTVDRIHEVWKENDYRKGTQLVFLDLSIPNQHRGPEREIPADKLFFYNDPNRGLTLKQGSPLKIDILPGLNLYSYRSGPFYVIADDSTGQRLVDGRTKAEAVANLEIAVQKSGVDNILRRANEEKIDEETRARIIEDWETLQAFNRVKLAEGAVDEMVDDPNKTGVLETSKFSAYEEMKRLLIEKGIPKEQVAFIHDFNTDLQKAKLFNLVNLGEIRVLLGSTEKMGAGTNVQKKLVGLHNVDVPWKPSDLEQRIGRAERQGNDFYTPDFTIKVFDYATEQTYDARMWEINEQKGTAQDRFRRSDDDEVEDISPESANAAEMKAAATGDPRILESIQLKSAIKKLDAQKKTFDRSKYDIQDIIRKYEAKDTRQHLAVEKLEAAIAVANRNPKTEDTTITLGDKTFKLNEIFGEGNEKNKEAASNAITAKFQRAITVKVDQDLGKYRGFDLVLHPLAFYGHINLLLKNGDKVVSESLFDDSASQKPSLSGVLQRVQNSVERLEAVKESADRDLEKLSKEFETAKAQQTAGFPKADELAELKKRHGELLEQLRAKRKKPAEETATDEGTDGTLKKVLDDEGAEEERLTREEMRQLPFVDTEDLISGTSTAATGSRVRVNARSQELYRRTREEALIRRGELTRGGTDYEDMINGQFFDPKAVKETVSILREKAKEAKKIGWTDEQIAVFTDHADVLEKAAKDGDGTAIIFVFDSALPEEVFHQTDYLNAADKSLLNRHSDDVKAVLDVHPVKKILLDKHFSRINTYRRIKFQKHLDAVLRAEIPPYLLKLTHKELAALGITPELRTDYMLKWFEGYAAKNGIESLDNFEKEELDVQEFIAKVKEAHAEQKAREPGSANEAGTGDKGRPETARGSPRSDRGSGERFGDDAARHYELDKGQKWASLPDTLRRAGIETEDLAYDVFGDAAALSEALKLIDENGIEGTLTILDNVGQLDVHHAMASFMIQRLLLDRAAQLAVTDPAEADNLRMFAREVGRKHVLNSIAAGRFTRAASVIPTSVEGVMFAFHGMIEQKYPGGKQSLSPERWEEIEAMGRRLEEKDAALQAVLKERTALKRKVKRLEDEKAGKRTERRTRGSDRRRKALVELVKKERGSDVEEIRARLKERFSVQASDTTTESEPNTLKSVLIDEEEFPIDDFAQVGALLLTEGIEQETPYLPEHFEAELLAEFGDAVRPHFQEIYRRSWELRDAWLADIRKEAKADQVRSKYGEWLTDEEVEAILGEKKERAARRQAIENIHKFSSQGRKPNRDLEDYARILSNMDVSEDGAVAAMLLADNLSRTQIALKLNEMGIKDKAQREALREGEAAFKSVKRLRQIEKDAIANELLAAQSELKTIDELRWKARNEVKKELQGIAEEMRRIHKGEFTYAWSKVLEASHIPRTLMASFDMSAGLRQGGFFAISAPEAQKAAFVSMFKSITEKGYGREIMAIEDHARFTLAQRSNIDFAMAGRSEKNYDLMGEELFQGEQMIEKVPLLGWLVAEEIVKPSERTYTAMLDKQRMIMFDIFAAELEGLGLTFQKNKEEFQKIAEFINVATGRGKMPTASFAKILMNLPLFAPRYTLSRLQLLNMTLNPVAYYRMPPAARKIVAKKAVRFYGTTGAVFGLASLAGALGILAISVNFDDDDSDFLKIKVENSHYDIFAGTLQPARVIIRLVHSAIRTKGGTDNRLPGEMLWDTLSALGRFGRGKLSPIASLAVDYGVGTDYVGNKTELWGDAWYKPGKAVYSRMMPLLVSETYEAWKLDGLVGVAKTTPATFFGLGVSNYKGRPAEIEPQTEAEKLAAKAAAWNFNGKSKQEKEDRDYRNDLTARSRRGDDIATEVDAAVESGRVTDDQKRDILAARTKTLLQDKAEGLSLDEFYQVMRVASPEERESLQAIFSKKLKNAAKEGNLTPSDRALYEKMGGRILGDFPMPSAVKEEFEKFGIGVPDVGDSLSVRKGDERKLTFEQHDKYRRETLERIYKAVQEQLNKPDYKDAPIEEQRRIIDRAIRKARSREQKETRSELKAAA